MNTSTAISPLELFRKEFPFVNWLVDEPVLCYPFQNEHWSEKAAEKARRLIIAKRLPLTTRVAQYWFGKRYRPALIIKPVPEEHEIGDEVPGECIDPDWWGQPRERE
jgi:hypothetical protein